MRCSMFNTKTVEINGTRAAIINIDIGKPIECKTDMCDITLR